MRCDLKEGLNLVDDEQILKHGITGEITFNGEWQDNVAEARLVVAATLDPSATDLQDSFIFSDPIQVGARKVSYNMSLEPGAYEIIAVIFRELGASWEISNILAVYQPLVPCSILPDFNNPLEIATESTIVDSVNLEVDLTKGAISGQIDFVGEWSSDLAFVVLIAFEVSTFNPCGLAVLPTNVPSAEYRVLVPESNYTLVVFAGESLSLLDLNVIGGCIDPETQQACVVSVQKNGLIENINITADLNRIPN